MKDKINSRLASYDFGQKNPNIQSYHFEIPKWEAALLITFADNTLLTNEVDFLLATIEQLVHFEFVEDDYINDYVQSFSYISLSQEKLAEILQQMDYEIPIYLSKDFSEGWLLKDTWDEKTLLYKTDQHYIAICWATDA